ncbi:indole-3-acetaldehyde oxidase-like [Homarus americanus]|uniref:indole-3-acetaldehyde oxidase-like n=1 Tax=Homarus americanus TaxID=6706 RepID=UPI001C476283|nr:indole-3-acetaldehyde oxidase-like [Homarus americanus]
MIPDMSRSVIANDSMVIGADVSITRLISELSEAGDSLSGFAYLKNIAETWKAVASTSVRNMGSWGGNIAAKVLHPEFPSDIFLGLLVAGAVITTGGPDGSLEKYNLEELLEVDLVGRRRVILDVVLTPASEDTVVRTFKIPPRPSNTHAQVNAGFRLQVDATNAHTVTGSPIIAYGGVNPSFVRAKATEEALKGMSLEDEVALQGALEVLAGEVIPDNNPEDASPEYRVALTQNLLYKTILGIIGDVAASTFTSGATNIIRPNSSAKQTFDQNTDVWPLAEPVMKLEAPIQCSGECTV